MVPPAAALDPGAELEGDDDATAELDATAAELDGAELDGAELDGAELDGAAAELAALGVDAAAAVVLAELLVEVVVVLDEPHAAMVVARATAVAALSTRRILMFDVMCLIPFIGG